MTDSPDIFPIFFGVSLRAQRHYAAWDILGLTEVVTCPIFPIWLEGLSLVLAIPAIPADTKREWNFRVQLGDNPTDSYEIPIIQNSTVEKDDASKSIAVRAPFPSSTMPQTSFPFEYGVARFRSASPMITTYHLMPLPLPHIKLVGPIELKVSWKDGQQELILGSVLFAFQETPPIDKEECQALLSMPTATRTAQVSHKCNKCMKGIFLYVSLEEKRPKDVPLDAIRAQDAPEVFRCGCAHELNLGYLKRGMHSLLRLPLGSTRPDGPTLTAAYESHAIQRVISEYLSLITSSPKEEAVQVFLEQNPIFWNFLSPVRIFHKPSILGKYTADFAILSASKVLWMIEIEKPQTSLVTSKNGRAAEMQKGLDQIRNWQVEFGDHRHACLDLLGFKNDDVHDVRYLLIAGLASGTSSEGMLQLRRCPPSEAEVYAFDELAGFVQMANASLLKV